EDSFYDEKIETKSFEVLEVESPLEKEVVEFHEIRDDEEILPNGFLVISKLNIISNEHK
ncbi:hypothetical protein KI387_022985, partial [Taxus chinensis]